MINIYDQFGTDKNLENQGVWIELGEGDSPSFKLARMSPSNKAYAKALEKATRKHKSALKIGALSNEKAVEIEKDVFVETILLDWKNVKDRSGKKVPFDKVNALKVMNDLPDLYEFLREQATEASIFREIIKEEEVKN